MNTKSLMIGTAVLCMVACGSPEILMPRDGTVPTGVNLSGSWQIQDAGACEQRRIRDAIRKTDGVDDDVGLGRPSSTNSRSGRSRNSGKVEGGLVYVFLELGEALKITQTDHGLFISFDRSVVEEYRFGGSQVVNVGQVQAQRAVGWEGETLIVETLDRNNMKLTERFRLTENGQVLERTIILRSRALEEESVVQRFDRVSN
jgi:hypothetical protein